MAIVMANPLTNPDRFFAELSRREVSLLTPFVIVLITASIPAIAEVICCFHAAAAGIAVELVAPFIVWFLFAGAFYAISIFLGGVGSFKRVLEFTGYGFIPQILSAIFNALIIHTPLPLLAPLPQFLTYEIAIIGLLLFLWSVVIWVFAVKHARNLSMPDALFTVVGGVVAGFLLMLVIIGTIASIIDSPGR